MLTKRDKHLAAAQRLLERGQADRALDELGQVVEADPSDSRTRLKMAEIHAQRGDLPKARDIYLATADLYLAQGFLDKATTIYKSVLKLMPGQPAVRERLGDTYRQLGRVGEAIRELDLAATEFVAMGRASEALRPLRRVVGLHPESVVSRIKLAETASQSGATDVAVHELRHAAEQLKHQGRMDEYVRVAERLLHHRPDDHALARELASAYIASKQPRRAIVKLQGPLRAGPRDPQNVALFAEALALIDASKAISVWRELAEIHEAAGRPRDRDACIRAALALDPTDGETRELAVSWGVAVAGVGRSRVTPPPLPVPLLRTPPEGLGAPRSVSGVSDFGPRAAGGGSTMGLSGLISAGTPASDVQRILAEADVFVKYGLGERAADHLRRVFTVYPQHRGVRERLATVLLQLGRKREAAAELATLAAQLAAQAEPDAADVAEQALALDPSSAPAAKVLGRARCLLLRRRPRRRPVPRPAPPRLADVRRGRRCRRICSPSWSRWTSSWASRSTTTPAAFSTSSNNASRSTLGWRRSVAPSRRRRGSPRRARFRAPGAKGPVPSHWRSWMASRPTIPELTAISGSPTSKWAFTMRPSPSSNRWCGTGDGRCSR